MHGRMRLSPLVYRVPLLILLLCLLRPPPGASACVREALRKVDVCNQVDRNREDVCPALVAALKCLEDVQANCTRVEGDWRFILVRESLIDEIEEKECEELTSPPPSPTSLSHVCHELKHSALSNDSASDPVVSIPIQFMASPVPSHSPDCPHPQPNPHLEHCSLFAFSHLRPFESAQLSTCLMPGPWYLVKRPDVEVIVHNVVPRKSTVENVARIDRVKVVFPAHACHGNHEKVYSATIGSGLPHTFKDGTNSTDNDTLLLNVTTSKDGSNGSAIMRSPIFNVTVSIRMHSGHFAVAIQSPKHLAEWKGRGLCYSGCPKHAEPVDVVAEQNAWCTEVASSTIRVCGMRKNILNGHAESGQAYMHACCFDVLKEQDYQMVVVANMAAEDAILLGPKKPHLEKKVPPREWLFQLPQQKVPDSSTSTGETPPQRASPSSNSPVAGGAPDEVLGSASPPTRYAVPVSLALLALTLTVLVLL